MAKLPGTDVVEDAKPDAESRPAEDFDFDFNYLAADKANGESADKSKDKSEGEQEGSPEKKEESEETKGQSQEKDEKPESEEKPETHDEGEGKTRSKPDAELQTKLTTLEGENITLKNELASTKAQIEQFKSVQSALEELQKEPLVFVRKYFPSLAEKVDARKYIHDKLKQEFGDKIADFDSKESYQEGTLSYKIRVREEEIRDGLMQEERKLQDEKFRLASEREAHLNSSKQAVMKRYNLTEAQFEKEVVEWAKNRKYNAWEDVARLRFMDDVIKANVAKALKESKSRKGASDKPEKGAEGVHGSAESGTPEHLREMANEFGERY